MFYPPRRFIKNIRNTIAAFGNIELPVDEIFRFHQINCRQIADNTQMIRSAVVICRIVPAARSGNDFLLVWRIIFDQIKMLYLNAVIFDVKKSEIFFCFAFTVMIGVAGETPQLHSLMARRTFPRSKRLSFGNTAPFMIKPPGVDIKGFVQCRTINNKLHAPSDIFHIKVIFPRCIEIGIIQLQHLFAGEGDISLIH